MNNVRMITKNMRVRLIFAHATQDAGRASQDIACPATYSENIMTQHVIDKTLRAGRQVANPGMASAAMMVPPMGVMMAVSDCFLSASARTWTARDDIDDGFNGRAGYGRFLIAYLNRIPGWIANNTGRTPALSGRTPPARRSSRRSCQYA